MRFLSSQAEEGFASFRDDLAKLREKNREAIPERHLQILNRLQDLTFVIITVVVSVAVIYTVWMIINSGELNAITKMTQWAIDLLKLARVMS